MNSNASTAVAFATDQTLTPQEQELATLYVKQVFDGVTGAIKGLTPNQWNFAPQPGAWSPALIVDHLTFVLDRVFGPVREQLMSTLEIPVESNCALIDSIVIHQFPNRLKKLSAPEFAMPSGRFASASEALDACRQLHFRAEEYLRMPGLRNHALEAMPLKLVTNGAYTMLDGYQWLLAAAAHAERHTKQILEVKSDANFPSA